MDLINDIAWRAFLIFLWMGSVAAVLLGVGLLAAPETVERINQRLGRWIDTDKVEAEFDRPRWTERYVYKHHRVFGAFLFLGSLVVLYRFLLTPIKEELKPFLVKDVLGIFDALAAVFIIGAVLAMLIGWVMMLRPSMLREFESVANRWISTDWVGRFFNTSHRSFDRFAFSNRKWVGGVLLIVGTYIAIVLGYLLLRGNWRL